MNRLILMAALICPLGVAAEDDWLEQLLTQLGASATVDEDKFIDWGVLPGPFVNPEQGLGI
ncbi:MAG: hypothetical protein ACRDBI_03425, partial [Shewanella sp.]